MWRGTFGTKSNIVDSFTSQQGHYLHPTPQKVGTYDPAAFRVLLALAQAKLGAVAHEGRWGRPDICHGGSKSNLQINEITPPDVAGSMAVNWLECRESPVRF